MMEHRLTALVTWFDSFVSGREHRMWGVSGGSGDLRSRPGSTRFGGPGPVGAEIARPRSRNQKAELQVGTDTFVKGRLALVWGQLRTSPCVPSTRHGHDVVLKWAPQSYFMGDMGSCRSSVSVSVLTAMVIGEVWCSS